MIQYYLFSEYCLPIGVVNENHIEVKHLRQFDETCFFYYRIIHDPNDVQLASNYYKKS